MLSILAAFLADPTPSPTPSAGVDPDLVTPGWIGFAVTAVIGVATVLLIIDMIRRTRRVRYRAEIAEQLDAEEATKNGTGTAE